MPWLSTFVSFSDPVFFSKEKEDATEADKHWWHYVGLVRHHL